MWPIVRLSPAGNITDINFSSETVGNHIAQLNNRNAKENNFTKRILDLDDIFAHPFSTPSGSSRNNATVMIAGGDVMLGRTVNYNIRKRYGVDWPFRYISSVLRGADMVIVNLESPFYPGCPLTNEGMVFCSDDTNVPILPANNITIVNIANNHIANYGLDGIETTLSLLEAHKINTVGARTSRIIAAGNKKFGFIGFNDVGKVPDLVSNADNQFISSQISKLRSNVDFVVATIHWGNEYTTTISDRQRELGRLMIDQGADLVIGHHPHWIQPVEIYKNKIIFYSLGNLVFDQMWSRETREGLLVQFVFNENLDTDITLIPVLIHEYGQPRILFGDEQNILLDRIERDSRLLAAENK